MHPDEQLNFNHIRAKLPKANEGIGVIRRINNVFPVQLLIIIHKSFVRPHLDYCDIICDQPDNEAFCNLIEN